MLIIYFSIPIVFFHILFIIYLIRYYDFKEFIFWILLKKQNNKHIKYIKTQYKESNKKIENIEEIINILQLINKGKFIEHHIATPAWYPIISLESCDNELWKEVKQNFIIFIQHFNNINKEKKEPNQLSYYIETNIQEIITQNKVINSILISKITVKSICQYLFNYILDDFETEILYKSSVEWKKEIAMKGKGDLFMKKKAIQIMINIINNNSKIYDIFGSHWENPKYYSVIMQPFIISPMINIPDILCNVELLLQQKKLNITDEVNYTLIDKCIYSYHPFPILERYDPITDTQYFISLDNLVNFDNFDKKTNILVFGSGIRKCAGSQYAYQILQPFIKSYFDNIHYNQCINFSPIQNHVYSGRINDNDFDIYQLTYMCYRILYILFFSK